MLAFSPPKLRYIASYRDTFAQIAEEGIYLASTEAFSLASTTAFVKTAMAQGYPMRMVIDTTSDCCVGWCDAIPQETTVGYLGTGLLPAHRNRGIGSRLIGEVIDLSRSYGYERIELDVRASNTQAIYVYKKLGFKRTALVTGGFQLGGNYVAEDVVQMALTL